MEVTSLQEHKAEGLPLFVSASSCHITTAYKEFLFYFIFFLREKKRNRVWTRRTFVIGRAPLEAKRNFERFLPLPTEFDG